MRTKRILLSLLLAVMVCSTGFVVLCGRQNTPKLEQQCKIDLGQDRVTEVKEYGEDGFLIPAYDVVLFSERLVTLMNDDKLRTIMGEKGVQNSQQYHISKIAQQWQQLFDDLVG